MRINPEHVSFNRNELLHIYQIFLKKNDEVTINLFRLVIKGKFNFVFKFKNQEKKFIHYKHHFDASKRRIETLGIQAYLEREVPMKQYNFLVEIYKKLTYDFVNLPLRGRFSINPRKYEERKCVQVS